MSDSDSVFDPHPRRSVALLVDDLALWQASGREPTGIQRVVLELVDTAVRRTDIRAWPALTMGGVAANDPIWLAEFNRESGANPRRMLRFIRSVVSGLPLPSRLRGIARAAYARLAVGAVAARQRRIGRAGETPSLLLVPGMFWQGNLATRARRLADRGVPLRLVVYDLFPIRHPEWYPPRHAEGFAQALGHLVPTSDRVVTLSEEVASQVVEHYPEVAGRVRVAIPAMHAHSPRTAHGNLRAPTPVIGPFLLALGTVEPRKNYRLILDAWARLQKDSRALDVQVVIAGRRGWLADDIETEIALDGARMRVIRVDEPTDSVVDALYRECIATVHASWEEGFGLPARESVARGIPTLMSSAIPRDGLPHGSFKTFDPEDVEGLAALMVETIVAGPHRGPVASGIGTGWEPVVSALVD